MFSLEYARYYYPVFLFLIFGLSIIQYLNIQGKSTYSLLIKQKSQTWMFLFIILFIWIVGLRPTSYHFVDMVNYAENYQVMKFSSHEPTWYDGGEWLFKWIMYRCSKTMSVNYFFLIIEVLYVTPVYLACRRLIKQNHTLLLLFCLGAYSFFSYGTNGIRNGAACSLVVLAITYIQGNLLNKIICTILCITAYFIHHSTALPILTLWFTYIFPRPKPMFYFWLFSIIISYYMGNYISDFFMSLGFDDRLTDYLTGAEIEREMEQFSQTGFRWDFLLYSSMPIIMGWYIIFKRRVKVDLNYILLLGVYIYSNAFWVMVIRASFSNRFAYLSWFIYPLVLAYPLLKFAIWKKKQGLRTGFILMAHFGFTFVMWLIGN
jgi:hypothetical protein